MVARWVLLFIPAKKGLFEHLPSTYLEYRQRLRKMLTGPSRVQTKTHCRNPFAKLDALYSAKLQNKVRMYGP